MPLFPVFVYSASLVLLSSADPLGLHQTVLNPDGEPALLRTLGGGRGADWTSRQGQQQTIVDPTGKLSAVTAVSKRPVRQAVNGSTPTGIIQIGTPPIGLEVIFDTGSDKLVAKTWDTVKRELKMVDGGVGDDVRPTSRIYDHNGSSTYVGQYTYVHGEKVPKRGYIAYGSGIAITDEGKDTVTVGGHTLQSFPVSEIAADSLTVLHSNRGVAGVLGLQHMKNHSMGESVFTRCRNQGLMTAFGYCRGRGNSGAFIWGDTATDGAALDVLGQIHWAVSLADVGVRSSLAGSRTKESTSGRENIGVPEIAQVPAAVGDQDGQTDSDGAPRWQNRSPFTLDLNEQHPGLVGGRDTSNGAVADEHKLMCPGGKCVAIVDTGSNIIAGPAAALKALTHKIGVKYDCSNLDQLPAIEFSLGGFRVSLPGSAYVMQVRLPAWAKASRHTRPPGHGTPWTSLGSWGGQAESEVNAEPLETLPDEGPWSRMVQQLHLTYGLDLRTALEGVPLGKLGKLLSGKKLCMPAFVPLNKDTALGPLWVVGTPLFEKYYTRWSWPQHEPAPKIFVKEVDQAEACQQDHGEPVLEDTHTVSELLRTAGPGLMRTEGRSSAAAAHVDKMRRPAHQPPEWETDEIRYPHWAKELASL